MEETKRPGKTITQEEYLQLKGLLLLAKSHDEQLQIIERAVASIIRSDGGREYARSTGGFVSDAVYANHDIDDLILGLRITVEDNDVEGGSTE